MYETSATVTKTKDTEFMIITTRGRLRNNRSISVYRYLDKSQHKSENNHGVGYGRIEDGGSQCPTGCKVVKENEVIAVF